MKALVDAAALSEHGQVNHCDFKPGSVRSTDLDREGITSAGNIVHTPPPMKAEKIHSGIPLVSVFDNIRDVLGAYSITQLYL
jgi:hypothetical protein